MDKPTTLGGPSLLAKVNALVGADNKAAAPASSVVDLMLVSYQESQIGKATKLLDLFIALLI